MTQCHGKTGFKDCVTESYVCNNDEATRNFEAKVEEYEGKIETIDNLINILNPRNQKIIRDFYIEELSLPQIADNEKFEVNTIKTAKKNSMEKLRNEWNSQNRLIITLNLT